ncbi:CPLN2 protein, partial [Oriolus oriolus]|nr:CPLN2 protein [Oriolus oriolus]
PGWLLSPAGRPYLDSILHKNQRRAFGEAPRPPRDPGYVLGGSPVPPAHHGTLGIEATTLFWPAKPRASGRPVLFQLQLWD